MYKYIRIVFTRKGDVMCIDFDLFYCYRLLIISIFFNSVSIISII